MTATGRCRSPNSGLPRPIYCHDGKIEIIEATGLPLGLFDDAEYDEFTFKAKPGDMFVFFSDGILDARNHAGDLFGRARVWRTSSQGCAEIRADYVVESLFKAVAEHAAGEETFDDQTVVAIKVKDDAQAQVSRNRKPAAPEPASGLLLPQSASGVSALAPDGLCPAVLSDVPLERLAERFGTPLYVYSASTIRERMPAFEQAFAQSASHRLLFGKANSNLGHSCGCWRDWAAASTWFQAESWSGCCGRRRERGEESCVLRSGQDRRGDAGRAESRHPAF